MKEVFEDFENDDWEEVSCERYDYLLENTLDFRAIQFSENAVFSILYYFYEYFHAV